MAASYTASFFWFFILPPESLSVPPPPVIEPITCSIICPKSNAIDSFPKAPRRWFPPPTLELVALAARSQEPSPLNDVPTPPPAAAAVEAKKRPDTRIDEVELTTFPESTVRDEVNGGALQGTKAFVDVEEIRSVDEAKPAACVQAGRMLLYDADMCLLS